MSKISSINSHKSFHFQVLWYIIFVSGSDVVISKISFILNASNLLTFAHTNLLNDSLLNTLLSKSINLSQSKVILTSFSIQFFSSSQWIKFNILLANIKGNIYSINLSHRGKLKIKISQTLRKVWIKVIYSVNTYELK